MRPWPERSQRRGDARADHSRLRRGDACSEPAKNVTLLFSRGGHLAGRAATDGQGRYRLRLPAGFYSVRRSTTGRIDNKLDPNRVRVFAGRVTRTDFSIDTGIR